MTPTNIPLPYRLFHLYIEPFILIPGGIYLSILDPAKFISGTVPSSIRLSATTSKPEPISPLLTHLLVNTAALYAMFGLVEALALRATKEMSVWWAVIFAIWVCDSVHLAVMVRARPEGLLWGGVGVWGVEDWVNWGILVAGWLLRGAFLVGFGVGKGKGVKGGKGKGKSVKRS